MGYKMSNINANGSQQLTVRMTPQKPAQWVQADNRAKGQGVFYYNTAEKAIIIKAHRLKGLSANEIKNISFKFNPSSYSQIVVVGKDGRVPLGLKLRVRSLREATEANTVKAIKPFTIPIPTGQVQDSKKTETPYGSHQQAYNCNHHQASQANVVRTLAQATYQNTNWHRVHPSKGYDALKQNFRNQDASKPVTEVKKGESDSIAKTRDFDVKREHSFRSLDSVQSNDSSLSTDTDFFNSVPSGRSDIINDVKHILGEPSRSEMAMGHKQRLDKLNIKVAGIKKVNERNKHRLPLWCTYAALSTGAATLAALSAAGIAITAVTIGLGAPLALAIIGVGYLTLRSKNKEELVKSEIQASEQNATRSENLVIKGALQSIGRMESRINLPEIDASERALMSRTLNKMLWLEELRARVKENRIRFMKGLPHANLKIPAPAIKFLTPEEKKAIGLYRRGKSKSRIIKAFSMKNGGYGITDKDFSSWMQGVERFQQVLTQAFKKNVDHKSIIQDSDLSEDEKLTLSVLIREKLLAENCLTVTQHEIRTQVEAEVRQALAKKENIAA